VRVYISAIVSRVFLRSFLDGTAKRPAPEKKLSALTNVFYSSASCWAVSGRGQFCFSMFVFCFFVSVLLTHGNYVLLSGSWKKKLIFVRTRYI
jgi:hypothetical protein